jgi:ParB-like chromosome segregation protein Spo0J
MSDTEFDELVEDIKKNGLQEHIWLYEGKILDGRNRYEACKDAGKPCPTRLYTCNDPHGFVISANLRRRHLNESQRASVAALLVTTKWGDNQHREDRSIDLSSAADMLNVSKKSVQRAVVVRDKGDQRLQKLVDDGKVAVSVAAKVAEKAS